MHQLSNHGNIAEPLGCCYRVRLKLFYDYCNARSQRSSSIKGRCFVLAVAYRRVSSKMRRKDDLFTALGD